MPHDSSPDHSSAASILDLLGDAPIVFGLRAQGHIPTVERMLAEGATWDEIGKEIGWYGPAVQQFYEEMERDAS